MTERPTSGPAPQWGEYGPVQPPVQPPTAPSAAPLPTKATGTPKPRRWDRPVTIALLIFGVLNVATSLRTLADLPAVLDSAYTSAGVGRYTATELAASIGVALNVTQVILLLVAVAVAVPRLARNRLAFWVPLAAGGVWMVVSLVLFIVAMVGDPALGAYVNRTG